MFECQCCAKTFATAQLCITPRGEAFGFPAAARQRCCPYCGGSFTSC